MSAYSALAIVEKELKEAKEKLQKYSNIRSSLNSLPGLISTCKDDQKATAGCTGNIIIYYEPIDAGSMSIVEKHLSSVELDVEDMIDQGNRLVAKYEEMIENLEKERERLLAEIAALEAAAAARRQEQQQYQTTSSTKNIVIKPSLSKTVTNQIK